MAWTYAIDPRRNDMVIGRNGKLLTTYGAEEVRQRILIALQHHYQEYFLNVPAGMPWYELILGSKDKKLLETLCRRTILEVPGVISVVDLQVRSLHRDYTVYGSVEVYGIAGPQIIELVETLLLR